MIGHVEDRIKKLWKDLSVLENIEDSRGLSAEGMLEVGRICDRVRKSYSIGRNLLEIEI